MWRKATPPLRRARLVLGSACALRDRHPRAQRPRRRGGDLLRHPGRDLDPAAIAERRCGRVGEHRQRRRPSGGEAISNSPGTGTRAESSRLRSRRFMTPSVHAVVLDLRQNTGGDTRQSDHAAGLSLRPRAAGDQGGGREGQRPRSRPPTAPCCPKVSAGSPQPGHPPTRRHPERAGRRRLRVASRCSSATPRWFREPLAFTGDLYLLVSPLTYSTALIASASTNMETRDSGDRRGSTEIPHLLRRLLRVRPAAHEAADARIAQALRSVRLGRRRYAARTRHQDQRPGGRTFSVTRSPSTPSRGGTACVR